MVYFSRQEQRILILLAILILLGTGVLLAKRFQPGWVMRVSMGKSDFDVEKDQKSPRLTSDTYSSAQSSDQKQQPSQTAGDSTPASADQPVQEQKTDQPAEKSVPVPADQPAQEQKPDQVTEKSVTDQPAQEQRTEQIQTGDAEARTQDSTPRININTATKEELETLPRIGPVIAQRIIEYRENYGEFRSIYEITEVSGIGSTTFQRLRELIAVDDHDGSKR